ncbi:MAG: ABC transporter ATP-binding protein/permease, partial [Methanobrevibacter sp.]|nr:ABC transporter ATP-binding protein/permease [Methanobrevibacter sp.]
YSTKAYDKKQIKYEKLNEILKESMAGIRVVKAFVRQDLENLRFQKSAEELREKALKPQYYYAFITPTLLMITYIGTAGILYVGGFGLLQGGGLTLGGVTAAMTYLVMALMPIILLGYMIPFVTAGISSLGRVYEVINEVDDITKDTGGFSVDSVVADEKIRQSGSENWDDDGVNLDKIIPSISFKDVNFAYSEESGKEANMDLKDINLDIGSGEVIGILGSTGSGKSTLIHLISRFYDVSAGKLSIGGIDIRDIPLRTLRSNIVGICLQNSNFFSGTIYDNLVSGAENTSFDKMIEATKATDAHDFINEMPQKYDTVISRGGVDLSGGQRQRLSIARTLILNPKILILDDSTSAVDVATEARIQKSIESLMEGVTQIIVAQRISAVLSADKIVLMDKGTIKAVGSHEELLKSNKLYQDIYASQFGVKTTEQEGIK